MQAKDRQGPHPNATPACRGKPGTVGGGGHLTRRLPTPRRTASISAGGCPQPRVGRQRPGPALPTVRGVETRSARQTAQRAARALVAGRTSAVGDLAARHAELNRALQGIAAARDRGDQLVQAARQRAQQLLEDAEQHTVTQRARYTAARQAALDAGWTSNDLTTLGYAASTGIAKHRPQPAGAPAGPGDPARQHQHPDHPPTAATGAADITHDGTTPAHAAPSEPGALPGSASSDVTPERSTVSA